MTKHTWTVFEIKAVMEDWTTMEGINRVPFTQDEVKNFKESIIEYWNEIANLKIKSIKSFKIIGTEEN
jgi:hypothetical protein